VTKNLIAWSLALVVGTAAALAVIREVVEPLDRDRPPAPDIEAIAGLIDADVFSDLGS